jgi:bacterial/archaeal transporter family-2 protein
LSPQNIVLAMLAVAAGMLFPIQTAANALLAKSVGGSIAATMFSITSSWFLLLLLNVVAFRQIPSMSDIAATPFYLLVLGGILGAIFLSFNVMLAPRLGAAATLCFAIAGQLMAALMIDRLGLFNFAVRELSFGRVLGVVLVFAGAVLVRLT